MPMTPPSESLTPYHILSIQGATGSGKTYRAVRGAPGRIAIHSTDGRWENVAQKEAQARGMSISDLFLACNYYTHVDLTADELFREKKREEANKVADGQANRINNELWVPFTRDYTQMMQDESVRTVLLDQADEFNEYLRLANFGKLEKNAQIASGPVNAEYKGLIKLAIRYRKNLVMIHQLKQRWRNVTNDAGVEKGEAVVDSTGAPVLERRINKSLEYLIHSFIQTYYVEAEKQFYVQILQAKKNPEVNGMTLPIADWTELMGFLDPDVAPEAWGVL